MKTTTLVIAALYGAAIPSQAASIIRWMGMDMNTMAAEPGEPFVNQRVTSLAPFPEGGGSLLLASLSLASFGPGPNMPLLSGSSTATNGISSATTSWNIDPDTNTLTLSLNHLLGGALEAGRFTGSEGVFYFYALSPVLVTVTYDYGIEETTDPTIPSKVTERGRSQGTVGRNRQGIGADGDYGINEFINRDGSRTFTTTVDESDELAALIFDFRIFDDPMPTSIPDGYLIMTFTPIPEPSAALLGLGALGLLLRRRR